MSLHYWCQRERYWIQRDHLASWAAAFAIAMTLGCNSGPPPDPQANQMVYFDRATKKAVVYEVSGEMPVMHPDTGKPTLVPALYCSECQQWFPAPPIEILERNPKAMICPKRHALTSEGPWPEESL